MYSNRTPDNPANPCKESDKGRCQYKADDPLNSDSQEAHGTQEAGAQDELRSGSGANVRPPIANVRGGAPNKKR
jgi:hypothetical protein